MCQENNLFHFCTCEEKKDTNKDLELVKGYTWTLTKYLGSKKTLLRGKVVIPKKDLGNGVTAENILHQLNSSQGSFDFDYSPNERDCVKIDAPDDGQGIRRISVLFKDGNWQTGGNSPFSSITTGIAEGKVGKWKPSKTKQEKP